MRTRPIPVVAVLLLAGAGAAAVLVPSGTQAAPTTVVRVDDYDFSPSTVTVRRGTTVKWVWVGRAAHDVEVVRGPRDFHSRVMTKGSYSRRFVRRGTYRIDCSIHATVMRMTVRVR